MENLLKNKKITFYLVVPNKVLLLPHHNNRGKD